tara:strand:+ start:1165 stop:1596 length:432 start_codon:yes stop_codon:yes gene_type:complete
MTTRLNLQYLLSYLGLIPFFFILIDKYFFMQIKEEIITDFLIYYILLIFVFIGSVNWNFQTNINNFVILYGFLPSMISVFIIILNLYDYNSQNIVLTLMLLLFIQLTLDYILLYFTNFNINFFYYLRLPLTLIIIILSGLIIV